MTTPLPLRLLAVAAFLSSAGARVVDPLLAPIANDFGRSVPTVALIVTAFSLPYGLNQLLLGPLGDRVGKLRVMLGALLCYAVFTGACALAGGLTSLTVLRALAGASSAGLIPVGLAYIGDHTTYAERPAALSQFLNGVVMAQIIAGPMGGLFADRIGWRGVFIGLALLALAAAALLAVRMPNLPQSRRSGPAFNAAAYRALLGTPANRLLLFAAFIDGVLLSGCFPYVAPYLNARFGLSFLAAGLVVAMFGIGALAYVRYVRAMIGALGEPGMIVAGGGALVFAALLASVAGAWPLFAVVEAAFGLGYFMFHTVLQARATEALPGSRSTAVATFAFVLFSGQAVGTLLLGWLIGRFDYPAAFAAQATGIAVMTAWCASYIRQTRPQMAPPASAA